MRKYYPLVLSVLILSQAGCQNQSGGATASSVAGSVVSENEPRDSLAVAPSLRQEVTLHRAAGQRRTLYPLPRAQGSFAIHSIGLEGRQNFGTLRLYRVDSSVLPGGGLPPVAVDSEETRPNPIAAAIFADRDTQLVFYSRRHNSSVSFPPGTGLVVNERQGILAEVDWNDGTEQIRLDFVYQSQFDQAVEVVVLEQSVMLEQGRGSLRVVFPEHGAADLLWASSMVTGAVQSATVHYGSLQFPLFSQGLWLHDIHFPELPGSYTGRQGDLVVECSFLDRSGKRSEGRCGMLAYMLHRSLVTPSVTDHTR